MALYTELSEELEATNRGVVALYAELDERSAQLREANEAKTRFLANVSHELRAPVTAVLGLVRLLTRPRLRPAHRRADAPAGPDPRLRPGHARPWSTSCSTWPRPSPASSSRRSDRGRPAPRCSARCAARCGRWPPGPSVERRRRGPDGLPPLYTDEVLLTQVLRNLLTNGIKFTAARRGAAGRPHRSGRPAGADRVGHRHRHPRRRAGRGSSRSSTRCAAQLRPTSPAPASGLPYARRLVTLLGGDLTLVSAVGQGSTFTVACRSAAARRERAGHSCWWSTTPRRSGTCCPAGCAAPGTRCVEAATGGRRCERVDDQPASTWSSSTYSCRT